jgi:hypothetical protein
MKLRHPLSFVLVLLLTAVVLCQGISSSQGAAGGTGGPSASVAAPERVRDRLWIWGHPAGVYNVSFVKNLPRKSRIEPIDAAEVMGLKNIMFIRYSGQPQTPFENYYKPFQKMDQVVWSLTGAGGATSNDEREAVLKLAERQPNITGFILDDFFHGHVTGDSADVDLTRGSFKASLSPAQLRDLRGRLVIRGRRLPLISVVYTGQISPAALDHLEQVDQITLWTWEPGDLQHLERNFQRLEALVRQKTILLGCYMYDFSKSKPLPVGLMKQQVELGYKWLQEGRIAGMVFLATPICDLELPAVEWSRDWISRVGDRELR